MARIVLAKPRRGTDVSGPYDEEPLDDAPRPQQPSQQHSVQPPQQPSPQPPQQPWPQPPQPFAAPPTRHSFASVHGLGTAVSILICLVVLARALLAASDWYSYKVVKDYVEGPVKDPAWIVPIRFGSWSPAASCSRCWPRPSCSLSGSGGPGVTLNSSAVDGTGAL